MRIVAVCALICAGAELFCGASHFILVVVLTYFFVHNLIISWRDRLCRAEAEVVLGESWYLCYNGLAWHRSSAG